MIDLVPLRLPFEQTPIGHMIDVRERAVRWERGSREARVLRELAALRRCRRTEGVAARLHLHRLTIAARRGAKRREIRIHAVGPAPATVQKHVAWW